MGDDTLNLHNSFTFRPYPSEILCKASYITYTFPIESVVLSGTKNIYRIQTVDAHKYKYINWNILTAVHKYLSITIFTTAHNNTQYSLWIALNFRLFETVQMKYYELFLLYTF